ncbi:beta-lactamase family protein [Candidatus Kaiserbacteria bacterium]|nr:beta-lactamase family protein [Candidatus Kaiserbacteria bacterium]
MPEHIARRVERAIVEKTFPGCVIGILADGMRTVMPFGRLRYEGFEVVTSDTVYDVASITKSIPTASLALTMIEGGMLTLNDRVRGYLPELHNDFDATVEDLMRYRVKGARLSSLATGTPADILKTIFTEGFDRAPGESEYTNLPALMLGLILERVAGAPLDALAQDALFDPLDMTHTTFFPGSISGIAPTEITAEGEIVGVPHDESARVFARARRSVGHAGLFSTADDLLTFCGALLRQPESAVVRGAQAGLGWQLHDTSCMGRFATETMFGKTGFTGTSLLVDLSRSRALVILSNRTYPKRPADNSAISAFRRDIADIVLERA